jgi:hypothetical protein
MDEKNKDRDGLKIEGEGLLDASEFKNSAVYKNYMNATPTDMERLKDKISELQNELSDPETLEKARNNLTIMRKRLETSTEQHLSFLSREYFGLRHVLDDVFMKEIHEVEEFLNHLKTEFDRAEYYRAQRNGLTSLNSIDN